MKKLKNLLSIILVITLITTLWLPVNAAENITGKEGKITWVLSSSGCLTLSSANGKAVTMGDFTLSSNPGWYAERKNITKIYIDKKITNLGNYAFYNLNNVTTIAIGTDVADIGIGVFYQCTSLSTFALLTENNNYCLEDGVLYTKDYKKLVMYPPAKAGKTYTVNEKATEIQGFAFAENKKLVSITTSNVEIFNFSAFINCKKLTELNVSLKLNKLGNKVFNGCATLNKIEMPPTVTKIGTECFDKHTVILGAKDSYAQTYAKDNKLSFTEKKYPVTLILKNDGKTFSERIVYYNYPIGELGTPEQLGYDFLHWKSTKGIEYTSKSTVDQLSTITLYAIYKPHTYTVTFDAKGGICGTTEKQVNFNSKFGDLPIPTLENYVFRGWYNSNGQYVDPETIYTTPADIILTAKYSGADYTIKLDPNGGVCSQESIVVTYETIFGELPVPEKDGYTFAGWFPTLEVTDLETEIIRTSIYKDTSITTLYAYWVPVINKVSNLKIKYVDKKSVKATWDKVENADGYEIYYKPTDGKFKLYKTTTDTNLIIKKLKSYKKYKIKVRAYSSALNGSITGPFSKTALRGKTYVAKPVVKKRYYKTNSLLQLKWKKCRNAKGYQIYLFKNGKYKLLKTTNSKAVVLSVNRSQKYKLKICSYTSVLGTKVKSKFAKVVFKA